MTAQPQRPLWLSVPAAAGTPAFEAAWTGRWRVLRMLGDHGVAAASTAPDAGRELAGSARSDGAGDLESQLRRVLARSLGPVRPAVTRVVLELGCSGDRGGETSAQHFDLARGTADTRFAAAMTTHQLDRALSAGRQAVERAKLDGVEMIAVQGAGAGSQTTNRAWSLLLAREREGIAALPILDERKPESWPHWSLGGVAARILARHVAVWPDPYLALRALGGFEHAALVGAMLSTAQLGLPLLALGTEAQIALRVAVRLNGSIAPWVRMAATHEQRAAEFGRSSSARPRCSVCLE